MRPLVKTLPPGSSLVFTAVPEAFFTYFKAAILAGVFFSSPFLLYQLWAFVSPGLYQREKKYVLPYLFVSSFFFLLGAVFCYFVVFPTIFRFFLSFATDSHPPSPFHSGVSDLHHQTSPGLWPPLPVAAPWFFSLPEWGWFRAPFFPGTENMPS